MPNIMLKISFPVSSPCLSIVYSYSFQIFRSIQEEGEKDPTWNSRIAYSLWAMEEGQQALAYARRWLELAPDDPDAQELVSEIEGFLWDQEEDDTGRKDNAKWKDDNG